MGQFQFTGIGGFCLCRLEQLYYLEFILPTVKSLFRQIIKRREAENENDIFMFEAEGPRLSLRLLLFSQQMG